MGENMKYTILLALSAIFVSAYGMEETITREIIIRNEVGQKVKIAYGLVDGKTVESVLADNETVRYPLEDEVTTFIVRPYGDVRGKVTAETVGMKPKDYAYKVKLELKKAKNNQNVLVVVGQGALPQEGMIGVVTSAFEAEVPNVLLERATATLKEYDLPYRVKLSLEKFEKNKKDFLIPGSGRVADVFPAARDILEKSLDKEKYFSVEPRYILGVDKDSSKENVKLIYSNHKAQWENLIKDSGSSAEDIAFAENVLVILDGAYQSLMLKFDYEDRLMKGM